MTKILVVDDMAVFREPIAAALRQAGFQAKTAGDGLAAIEAARGFRPDVILLDLAMPRMDGLAFLRARRTEAQLKQARVILLSAVSDREQILEAGKLGVRDYLLKSQFSLPDLIKRIHKTLATPPEQMHGAEEKAAGAAEPHGAGAASTASAASGAGGGANNATPPTTSTENAPSSGAPKAKHPDADADADADAGYVIADIDSEDPIAALKSLKPIMRRSDMQEKIDDCGELEALSPTVVEILKITQRSECSVEAVARAIKRDHAIALKILKLANSTVYSRGEPVESVAKAVMRIGLSQIRQTVMNLAVVDRFGKADPDKPALIDVAQFWEHSIATGLIASQLALGLGADDADVDTAFTLGLIHDVGRLVLAEMVPDEYAEVIAAARELRLPLDQVESRMLLINHADAMDRILHTWHFPRHLVNAIAFHHLSIDNIRHMARTTLVETATLALANRLARALLLGSSGNDVMQSTHAFLAALKVPDDVIEQIERDVPDQTDDMKFALLSNMDRESWPARRQTVQAMLATPLRPLFVGVAPRTDSFRMFFDRIADFSGGDDARPNLVVMHITDPRDVPRLSELLAAAERDAGLNDADRPPMLAVATKQVRLDDRMTRGRTMAWIAPPVNVQRLIDAVNKLTAPGESAVPNAA